jgi:hypothetical protein
VRKKHWRETPRKIKTKQEKRNRKHDACSETGYPSDVYPDHFAGSYVGRFLFLLLAIVLTGVETAMSLNMRLIPNPGDGIVQAIADTIHKSVGFTKNRKNTQMQFRHNLIKLVKMRRCRKINEIFLHLLFM